MEYSFEIGFSDDAKKTLKKLDGSDLKKVLKHIGELNNYRSNNNVKVLKGDLMDFYRLRVGKIRVIFEVDVDKRIIKVVEIGFRGSVYR